MLKVVFVDLDDTLFQTARKSPRRDRLAAVDRDGEPLSYQSSKQVAFLEWLSRDAMVVPVTGRSVEAFRRVVLPLGPQAICSFGGVVLSQGAPHPLWHAGMTTAAELARADLQNLLEVTESAASASGIDIRYRIIADAGLPLYVSIKHNAGCGEGTARLAADIAPAIPPGWRVHRNGANMALLPPFLDKRFAVSFFLEEIVGDREVVTIGVGDSLSDLGFMAVCDYALAPAASQIFVQRLGEDDAAVLDRQAVPT